MRKIYIITETNAPIAEWCMSISVPMFAFTSKKRAMEQMDIIKQCITDGGWWSDGEQDLFGEIISDDVRDGKYQFIRDLTFLTPNKRKQVIRLQMIDNVNCGYRM